MLPPAGEAGWLDPNANALLAGAPKEKGAPNVAGLLGAEPGCVCPNGLLDGALWAPNGNEVALDPKEKGCAVVGKEDIGDCAVEVTSKAAFWPNGNADAGANLS